MTTTNRTIGRVIYRRTRHQLLAGRMVGVCGRSRRLIAEKGGRALGIVQVELGRTRESRGQGRLEAGYYHGAHGSRTSEHVVTDVVS